MKKRANAFTIVELLIVIVVIAILAAISIVAYSGIQERARQTKAASDLSQIQRAIVSAQTLTGRTLMSMTASLGADADGAGRPCWQLASGTDLAALPKTHQCWVNYDTVLQLVSEASGVNITGIVDPWGRPYFIDQNEGEGAVAPNCNHDLIGVYKRPHVNGSANTYETASVLKVPFARSACV